MWSVKALIDLGCNPVVLVVPTDHLEVAKGEIDPLAVVDVAAGGKTRQDSVFNGVQRISSPSVVVHDAARPFVDETILSRVLGALDVHDAAIPVLAVDDTVKLVDGARVVRTMDRSDLGLAQTPQAFRTDVLRSAHERARREGVTGTDDAQLVELFGGSVAAVPGTRRNVKVTHPEDFAVAEALMQK